MKQSNRKDEIDAARLRLETAKRWAVSASKNLDAARQDDIHARAEVQEAEAFLKSKMKAKKKKKVANACTEIVMHQPETNVKGEIESKWVTTVIVTGCGIPAGSGVYKQCGFCDGVPKYIKNAEKNGPHVAFMIYRCKVREESRKWYISIVAPNSKTTHLDFISVFSEGYLNNVVSHLCPESCAQLQCVTQQEIKDLNQIEALPRVDGLTFPLKIMNPH
ncbi:hypothetical protein HJC23_012451 [Cyclotella cryptica]|uniref:Uncharacterized protein n=1 Tax=Cyclotella cryptica TaxID=29204 RepID=A0ABD3P4I5_9STRA